MSGFPEKPSSLDELMSQADTIMYEEKRNRCCIIFSVNSIKGIILNGIKKP